ncbi:MAG TPA: biopolymer transporter ExbD [Phycisphaerae bacterium]|nr:biopolymer transporter ExbD [Phycisphaerae bacterium]
MRLMRQSHPGERPQLNMASMIDVVFLMLIFFMCTSSFARPEKSLSSALPRAGSAGAAARDLLDPVRVKLSVAPGGSVAMTCDELPCANVDDLTAMLRARRALGEPPVFIAGAGAVPFEAMVGALDACHRAGLTRVAFSAEGTEP